MAMKVSVCVVAYNEENMLPALLADIGRQTYPHEKIEIVLVDSCSEDRTRSIMEHFAEKNREEFLNIQVLDNAGRIQSFGSFYDRCYYPGRCP